MNEVKFELNFFFIAYIDFDFEVHYQASKYSDDNVHTGSPLIANSPAAAEESLIGGPILRTSSLERITHTFSKLDNFLRLQRSLNYDALLLFSFTGAFHGFCFRHYDSIQQAVLQC